MSTRFARVLLLVEAMMAPGLSLLPLFLLPRVGLGSSTPAPCFRGDQACPGNSRSLLQSSRKLNVDQWHLGDQNLMLASSDEIVDDLQARAEAVVRNGQDLTPLERTTLEALNKTLLGIIPTMLRGHTEDQAEIDAGVQSIRNCNSNFDEDSKASKTAKGDVDAGQKVHKDCRSEQSKLKAEAVKASGELDKFWKPLVLPTKPEVASRAVLDNVKKWVKDNEKPLEEKLSRNTTAHDALYKKAGVCDSKQKLLESGFCQWFGRATAANKSYARCWSQSGVTFAKLRKEALESAEGRKVQFVSIHKIQCYMGVIFRPSRQNLNKCKQLSPDASQFNLTNTVAEAQKDVAGELGPMNSKPGDEGWKKSVYAGLANIANVTPCAAVAHYCDADYHVQDHRCKACGIGETNKAGDDALGNNTACSAILCEANEHVVSNACADCPAGTTTQPGDDASGGNTNCTATKCAENQRVSSHKCTSCPAGMNNSAGDDASGGDTSCQAILCRAGQRVKSNACHTCEPGTENKLGGHSASGADTSCTPIRCLRNQHVQSKACHTCPPGTLNTRRDDASGTDTNCTAISCGKNEKVTNNTCRGCPAGKVNDAGDDASVANTTCTAVICAESQHVVSKACMPCADGTKRAAGDDASGADTICDAIKCQTNQRVVSHACVACPTGEINQADDDASGSDTLCQTTTTTTKIRVATGSQCYGDDCQSTAVCPSGFNVLDCSGSSGNDGVSVSQNTCIAYGGQYSNKGKAKARCTTGATSVVKAGPASGWGVKLSVSCPQSMRMSVCYAHCFWGCSGGVLSPTQGSCSKETGPSGAVYAVCTPA